MNDLRTNGERTDRIGFGDLVLIQKPDEFCYGVDAVLLADFAAKNARERDGKAADLGTGTGIIPLILSYKTQAERIYGVEVQQSSWERACRNCRNNGLAGRLEFIRGDVAAVGTDWGENLRGQLCTVTCNPPYVKKSGGLTNCVSAKTVARHETTAALEDFVACAAYLLRPKGDFFMIHRPSRLVDICCAARANRLEPKLIRFVSPKKDAAANMVLVHMVKDGGAELKIGSPLWIYEEDGSYTPEVLSAYER